MGNHGRMAYPAWVALVVLARAKPKAVAWPKTRGLGLGVSMSWLDLESVMVSILETYTL